ncbi:MAG: transposase [Roseomonas sp.]|nr:transposase [Roseomonas sp.]MCA3329032.1 transposase [Roseomonas sp.]MCA3331752.1 transposase [Roseomonas sp.]MCA3333329.1 transposase [Roseomonas sp.]MCA3347650.1 transposase [Roseomonas sp.]
MNSALSDLSTTFDAPYSPSGRDSIPLERLLRTLLLRWFLGLGVDDPVWDATTFTKNRDHLLEGNVAVKFLAALLTGAAEGEGPAFRRAFLGLRHSAGSLGE